MYLEYLTQLILLSTFVYLEYLIPLILLSTFVYLEYVIKRNNAVDHNLQEKNDYVAVDRIDH